MAAKPKTPARPGGRAKAVSGSRTAGAVAAKAARTSASQPARTSAAKTPPVRAAAKKSVSGKIAAGAAKKTSASPAMTRKPVAKKAVAAPAAKSSKPVRSAPKGGVRSKVPAANPRAAVVAPAVAQAGSLAAPAHPIPAPVGGPPLPTPKSAARVALGIRPEDLASAHEYLLARSASRSEAPITVGGMKLLTEEELLAMPESEYMNDAQRAFFRYRLQQMEKELLANAGETTEHLRETVIVPDPADRATIEEEHALELRTRDRERKLLKKVQASLAQIDAGEYGYCEETGEPIGIPRLLARPTATLSLEAQQRRELKQKLFGD
ncbi:DnaK suppressor protein [Burkholderiales bacterium GJ-E10]|nr:DnaK suppressor protein [Burkholderiales bacterium GJ-E10]